MKRFDRKCLGLFRKYCAEFNDTGRHKLKVNEAVKQALRNPKYSFDHCFEAGIEYRSAEELKKTSFVVYHRIQGALKDSSLREWAKDQKLVPWVAVAAQLPVSLLL
jgi:sacsin